MSIESAKKFVSDLNSNEELKSIFEKAEKKYDDKEKRRDYIAKEAKKHGYDFTALELKEVKEEKKNSGEISDDDLLNVAGGMVGPQWTHDPTVPKPEDDSHFKMRPDYDTSRENSIDDDTGFVDGI